MDPPVTPEGVPETPSIAEVAVAVVETLVPQVVRERPQQGDRNDEQSGLGEAPGRSRIQAEVVPPNAENAPRDLAASIPTVPAEHAPAPRVPAQALANSAALREAGSQVPADPQPAPDAGQAPVVPPVPDPSEQVTAAVEPSRKPVPTSEVAPKGSGQDKAGIQLCLATASKGR